LLNGTSEISDIFEHCLRVHYLWGILKESYLSSGTLYVGGTELTGEELEQVTHKIWHYNGIFSEVDLSVYDEVDEDDGDGGTDCDGGTTTEFDDHYRAGSLSVNAGSGTVTFTSPLDSNDYQLTVYVTTSSGYEQRNIAVSAKYASGFTYTDVLQAGTLSYFAVLNL